MKRGRLTAVAGSMFSGKTTYLIKVFGEGEGCVVFKPDLDKRYTKRPVVVSHNREEIPSVLVNNDRPEEMLELVGEARRVLIDEANFFSDKLIKIVNQLTGEGREVVVAGLTRYADGGEWGPMNKLLELADQRLELSARCDGEAGKCKSPATRSYRKVPSRERVRVAGAKEYGAACERHYPSLHHKA